METLPLKPSAIASAVRELLATSAPGTLVEVDRNGAVTWRFPEVRQSSGERRERVAAVFLATSEPPGIEEITARVALGLRKLGVIR